MSYRSSYPAVTTVFLTTRRPPLLCHLCVAVSYPRRAIFSRGLVGWLVGAACLPACPVTVEKVMSPTLFSPPPNHHIHCVPKPG